MIRRINRRRDRLGLSYAALGERAEVDPSQVSRICRGEFATYSDSVMQICRVLGVSVRPADGQPPPALPTKSRKAAAWAELERSVRRAWDDTPAGAERLARVIAAVAEISGR